MMTSIIRKRAKECLEQYKLLIGINEEMGSVSHDVNMLENRFARFKIWAGHVGVFADGPCLLDRRLHESTQILMLQFLTSLLEKIHNAMIALNPYSTFEAFASIRGPTIGSGGLTRRLSFEAFSAQPSSSEDSDMETEEDQSILTMTSNESIQGEALQAIENATDRLYRLALMTREDTISAQNERAERYVMKDDDGNDYNYSFTQFAHQVVGHLVPGASEFLHFKLSYGIVIRRKRFLFQQSHQGKLPGSSICKEKEQLADITVEKTEEADAAMRPSESTDQLSPGEIPSPALFRPRTLASSHTTASLVPRQSLPLTTTLEDVTSDHGPAHLAATPSLGAPLELPHPPKPAVGGREFECPYCCIMVPIEQLENWSRHVLEDLAPYTCIFEECTDNMTLFRNKIDWIAHLQDHFTCWRCTSKAHPVLTFASEDLFFAHMRSEHARSCTESQLPVLAKRNKFPTPITFKQCPLCGYAPNENDIKILPGATGVQIDRSITDHITEHIASHLLTLALKSLPWQDEGDDSSEDSMNAHSGGTSSSISFSESMSLHFSDESTDQDALQE